MTPHDLLRRHPILGALTDGEARALLRSARCRMVAAGEIVFLRDDPTDGLYGVLSGSVLIVVDSAEGKELVLNRHGAGEFFGEVSLLDGEGRSATAVAYEPSRLVHIDRDRLLAFLKQRPDALLRIVQLLCARMRRVTRLVEELDLPGCLDAAGPTDRRLDGRACANPRARRHGHPSPLAKRSRAHAGRVARVRRQAAHGMARLGHRRTRPPAAHCSRRRSARTPVHG